MAEINRERLSDLVKKWDEDQWRSAEWRQYLVSTVADYECLMERLLKAEELCSNQQEEIKCLEKQCALLQKQLSLLQKTLDIAERYSRPIVIPNQTKDGDFLG